MSDELLTDIEPEEATNRFPELLDIRDDDVRDATTTAICNAPEYVWTAPAASSHHPIEHRVRHGLWIHIQRVCTAFERIAPSMVKQNHLSWYDVDCGRAACLTHDLLKYGRPPTSVDKTTDDHDIVGAEWLSDNTALPDSVIGAVRGHMGPWGSGGAPSTHLAQMVHVSDMVASDEHNSIAVKEPHEIIRQQFPNVSIRE